MKPVYSLAAAAMSLALASCTTLPASGPYSTSFSNNTNSDVPYELIELSANSVPVLDRRGGARFVGTFADRRSSPDIRLGVGDVVSVTIFEAQAGGLFIPEQAAARPGNFVQLPNQTVDRTGNITIPYAGEIYAKGKTAAEIQDEIVSRLKNRAIEPQAIVAIAEQRANGVSVSGDVNSPIKYALQPPGERILDALARAGGAKTPAWQTFVTLQRGRRKATISLNTLIVQPENNIYIQPGDTLYVYSQQRTFIAFGATGQQGQFNFDQEELSLAEAVGKTGGLIDTQADPGSVYLYRIEPRKVVQDMGVDMTRWGDAKYIPVIYWVNFRNPAGYFLATRTPMNDKDILYVSNAASVDITKLLQFIRVWIATADEGTVLRNDIQQKP